LATPPHHCPTSTNLKAALTEVDAAGAFLSAASPGVISLFFRNDHYAKLSVMAEGARLATKQFWGG
jgi:hypothetical protein